MYVCMYFERERERESMSRGEAERESMRRGGAETERELENPDAGLKLMNARS